MSLTLGRDLVVLIGQPDDEAIERFRPAGKERFLVLVPRERESAALTDVATVVNTSADLFAAILELRGALPAEIVLQRTRDPWATVARHRAAAQTVKEALQSKHVQNLTVAEAGKTWLLQGLENLPAIARQPSIAALRGAFAGVPAVIISPGPSLSKNVHQLAALENHALLISGTHSLTALAAAGVVPDLVVAADPGDLARHYESVDLSAVEAFIVGATCRPEVFDVPARRVFSFASNGQIDDWIFDALDEDTALAAGGSVACSQLSLAVHLGCDPVVFVGQDLSFTDRYYAKEGLDGDARVEAADAGSFVLRKGAGATGPGVLQKDGTLQFTIPQKILQVPGYHGGTVPTTASLHVILTWFQAVAEVLAGKPRLINSTEGGARIRGMEQLPLESIVAEHGERRLDVGAILDQACAACDPADRRARLAATVAEVSAAVERSTEIARLCCHAASRAASEPEQLEALERLERRLSQALRPARLCSLVAHDEIVAAQEAGRTAKNLAENLAAAQRLFQVVERAGELLMEPLRKARRELS
ncbi:MAG: DUF115 domain-containing protein [Deltaproteobacteria bacterium]|nr:DUF115 domain-containing protein [Deltaproteobacteria bacterium]